VPLVARSGRNPRRTRAGVNMDGSRDRSKEPDIGDKTSGQLQLGQGTDDEPGPTVRLLRRAERSVVQPRAFFLRSRSSLIQPLASAL